MAQTLSKEGKQGSQPQSSQQQGVQQRGSEQRGMSRRYSDPWASSLMPSDFFSMNPFSIMRRMQDEMDRVFGSASGGGKGGQTVRTWTPPIEVSEKDNNYVVCAELPGLRPEDVNVEMTDDALVIEGERRQEHEENQGGVHRSERSYGHFYRAIPLPEGVKADQTQANFKDGVLEVKIPMSEQQQQQRRRIPVQGGSQHTGPTQGTGGGASTAGTSQPGSGQGNKDLREGKLPGGGQ